MIVGFGENSIDIVYRLPRYPQPGTSSSKVAIEHCEVRPGGQVATTLATCAAFGLATRYVGTFGNDEHAMRIRAALHQRGVDISLAIEREAPNRYAIILVDASHGERVVLWQRDALLTIGADDVNADWIEAATLVHVDATDEEAAIELARLARRAGLEVTCDIDRVTPRTSSLLELVSIPILAEHIPSVLTGEPDVADALRALRRTHAGRLVVTLGSEGAAMLDGEEYVQVPGYTVNVVDSTGAGDVFRGAFIYALLRGETSRDILRFANAAAAASCTRPGALDAVPSLVEVQALLASADG